uniref:Protein kinase domain-containing protein n=1 Tax=Amphiprion ocellaris TaxID=80972 RepID=A0AAQ5YU97_AMPOC
IGTSSYLKVSVVGQGTYGIVYKVKCRSTGKEFALKRYNYGVEDSTVRELSCLAALKGHPYVVSVHDCFFDEGKVAMLLSYVPYTLSGIIHKGHGLKSYHEPGRVERSIPLSFVARFSRQVAHALSCMHEMNIVHRDLTPFNVLLTEDLTVKVADMGLSRQCSKWMSPTVVTEAVGVQGNCTCTSIVTETGLFRPPGHIDPEDNARVMETRGSYKRSPTLTSAGRKLRSLPETNCFGACQR